MPPARSERLRSVAASGVARKATHALSLTAEADAFVRPTACRRGCARTAVLRAADTADRPLQALPPSPIPSHPIPSHRWKQTRLTLADSRRNGLRFADCCYPRRSVSSAVTTHCAVQPSLIRVDRTARVGLAVPFGPPSASPRLASPTRRLPALLYRSRRLGRTEPSEAPTARHVWLRLRC